LIENHKQRKRKNHHDVDVNAEENDSLKKVKATKQPAKAPPKSKLKNTKTTTPKKKSKKENVPHTSHNSSLWNTTHPLVKGQQPVNREMIEKLVTHTTIHNPLTQVPTDLLRQRIPEMVEFYVMLLQRQLLQQKQQGSTSIINPIFQRYHFCNNYRELDRGTAYFRSQILLKLLGMKEGEQQQESSPLQMNRLQYLQEVLGMAYYYRQCNLIESFKDPNNPAGGIPRLGRFNESFVRYIETYRQNRKKFFTPAHLNQGFNRYINNCSSAEKLIRDLSKEIHNMNEFDMKKMCSILRRLPGVGEFTCWQIACDLEEACCFCPKIKITPTGIVQVQLPDEFCVLGPGAEKGLQKIFGKEVYQQFTRNDLLGLAIFLRDNMDHCLALVGQSFPLWKKRRVTLKVIEHALCEFQKFVELDTGYSKGQRSWHSRAGMDELKPCCSV
jgi:hypothetical protein